MHQLDAGVIWSSDSEAARQCFGVTGLHTDNDDIMGLTKHVQFFSTNIKSGLAKLLNTGKDAYYTARLLKRTKQNKSKQIAWSKAMCDCTPVCCVLALQIGQTPASLGCCFRHNTTQICTDQDLGKLSQPPA